MLNTKVIEDLRSKRIAVLGYAREGQALIEFFIKHQINNFEIFDENPKHLQAAHKVNIVVFKNSDFSGFDLVFRSPGISPYTNQLEKLNLTSQTQLWFDLYPDLKTICITGTKGKSTSSSLITHLLNKLDKKAIHIGNIGRPLLDLPDPEAYDFLVVELSSYQLYKLKINPTCAVFLNLFPEHLNWHLNFENYRDDKLRICQSNNPNTKLVIHNDLKELIRNSNLEVSIFPFQENEIPCPALLGQHNQANIQAAVCCLRALGFNQADIIDALVDFQPLPHRLETVHVSEQNVRFICDALSTIPQATIAALQSLPNEKIQLILGGLDRGHDWNDFAKFLAGQKIKILCFAESGHKIHELIKKMPNTSSSIEAYDTLEQAINAAKTSAQSNSVILFSPAAPSNLPFANYEERAKCFVELAREQ
jgi:UDP-N-acetylmuramoylalanine--D-glutamate ligase